MVIVMVIFIAQIISLRCLLARLLQYCRWFLFIVDFLTWTRLSVDGFTPSPCTKHCAVAVTRHQTSRRNHSMPTFRSASSAGVDLHRASTGRGHRPQRPTDAAVPWNRSASESRRSVETAMTELSGDVKTDGATETGTCCRACASSLRRSHRVSSQPPDDADVLFNSSREQLILEPNSSGTTTCSRTRGSVPLPPSSDCTDTLCSCHSGAVNLTFVSDDVTLHRSEGFVVGDGRCHDHVNAAQALMQPVSGQTADGQAMSESPIELLCYSVCRTGDRLVVEDLESCGGHVVSSVQSNGMSPRPLDVREAWPDSSHVSSDRHLNDVTSQTQLLVCIV